MARCLVTGNRGYIGSPLSFALKDLGHEVCGIDLVDGEDILDGLKDQLAEENESADNKLGNIIELIEKEYE